MTGWTRKTGLLLAGLLLAAVLGQGLAAAQGTLPGLATPAGPERPPLSLKLEFYSLPGDGAAAAALFVVPDKEYHAYAHEPGGAGLPLVAKAELGGQALSPVYPQGVPEADPLDPGVRVNLHDPATPVLFPLPRAATGRVELTVSVSALLCSPVSCLPASARESFAKDIGPAALPRAEAAPWFAALAKGLADPLPAETAKGPSEAFVPAVLAPGYAGLTPRFPSTAPEVGDIGTAALLAVLAGLILNVMPCVLPVASLKFSGILAASASDPLARFKELRQYNIFFALGILTYFIILSVILGLAGMAWGQLFQSPGVVLAMTAALFGLALSLFGLYNLPVIDLKRAPMGKSKVNHKAQAFVTGVLATLLATPCSGPFLGGVLAWTLLQPVWVISTVFFCIGLGMSGPYLFFALRPDLIRFFPKPGPWLAFLEKGVGFILIATCIYLLSVLPPAYLFPSLAVMWSVSVAAWIWGGWTDLSQPTLKRRLIRGAALALVLVTAWLSLGEKPAGEAAWEPFSRESFAALLGRENILVDFTADWCPNCKFVEKTALTEDKRTEWKRRYAVRFVKADLTADNPEALALLRALKSQSIPVAALFPKGEQATSPLVLRDVFTAARLSEAMAEVFAQPN